MRGVVLAGVPKNALPEAACQVSKDQRGVNRPRGPRCDIGSFERNP